MRDRYAVGRAQTAEVPPLHAAGETLTDRRSGDVHELAWDEVSSRNLGADLDQGIGIDTELHQLALGLDLRLGEVAALGLVTFLTLAVPAPS